jgi:hypothetical protein
MLFIADVAHADRWDPKGWTKLGQRTVNGKYDQVDTDSIVVGRYEGRYSKLTIVVEKHDIELVDFDVYFANGQKWTPPGIKHNFRDNSRSRVIDLPGDDRIINKIVMKYRNLDRRGQATVEIWGFKTTGAGAVAHGSDRHYTGPATYTWGSAGWEKLGERIVNGGRKGDSDTIMVGAYKGRFNKLTIVVLDSDIELVSMHVKFGSGQDWRPAMAHYFREEQRSRVLDLPGADRVIKSITFNYRNLHGGGNARVQVWAK